MARSHACEVVRSLSIRLKALQAVDERSGCGRGKRSCSTFGQLQRTSNETRMQHEHSKSVKQRVDIGQGRTSRYPRSRRCRSASWCHMSEPHARAAPVAGHAVADNVRDMLAFLQSISGCPLQLLSLATGEPASFDVAAMAELPAAAGAEAFHQRHRCERVDGLDRRGSLRPSPAGLPPMPPADHTGKCQAGRGGSNRFRRRRSSAARVRRTVC